jgi:aspartate/methionine/tyrosine aminotransferase
VLLHEYATRAFAEPGGRSPFSSTFGWGNPLLIDAIARRYRVNPDAILATTGCTTAIAHVFSAYLEPGAHVVIESPYFDLLARLARNRNAEITLLQREPRTFAVDPQRLVSVLRSDTKLVVLTNAHNPTGAHLGDAALLDIARAVWPYDIPVLVDEVYGDFVPDHERSGPAATLDPCFISVNSLTKVYGLHALKCGWIVAGEQNMARIRPVYSDLESGSSKITHGIAALVLDDLAPFEEHWRAVLLRNRPLVLAATERLRGEGLLEGTLPEHGCMYFPRLTRVADTRHFAAWLWDRYRVGIAPGEFFGAPGHVRIGFGQMHDSLRTGLERFAEGLRSYSQ